MSRMTLSRLFFSDPEHQASDLDKSLDPQDPNLIAIRSDIEKELPKLSWKAVEKELGTKLDEVLDIGLDDVFFAAWRKYSALQEYADPKKHPPEETALVPLASHTVRSGHRPRIDIMVNNMALGGLRLEVQVALDLEGVVLKVHHGRIWDLCAGSYKASGSLKCTLESRAGKKEILALQRQTAKRPLPGICHLKKDGVRIPPPRAAKPRRPKHQEEVRP